MVVESKKDPKDAKEASVDIDRNLKCICDHALVSARVEGDVAEKKDDKMTIQTKGKSISKDGTKDNPAIHVKRKGNDVVKRASELAVLDPEESIPKTEKVLTRAQAAKMKGGS